ncbi:MAG: hypothetical protein ACUZ8N_14565 [Candidatus Scalindua sp.]|jgi:hypothetical protein
MKGDTVLDDNHIARLCLRKHVENDQIQATAFHLRPSEDYLSVNWLEYLKCSNRDREIVEIQKVYSAKLEIKPPAKIAVLNVGEVREKVRTGSQDERNLEVLHEPLPDPSHPEIVDPSHSGIYNLKQNDEIRIGELILQTVRESYPALM